MKKFSQKFSQKFSRKFSTILGAAVVGLSLAGTTPVSAMMKGTSVPVLKTCVPVQADGWSCGVHSGAKLLHYVHSKNPAPADQQMSCVCGNDFNAFKDACPKTVVGARANCDDVGPSPETLAAYMNQHSRTHQFEVVSAANVLELAKARIDAGNPVIALVKVGSFRLMDRLPVEHRGLVEGMGGGGIEIPLMHYVLINGYDDASQTMTYVDTNAEGNAAGLLAETVVTYDEMRRMWNWQLEIPMQQKAMLTMAMGMFGHALEQQGYGKLQTLLDVTGNTMIAVKPPVQAVPVVAAPAANQAQANQLAMLFAFLAMQQPQQQGGANGGNSNH